MSSVVERFLKYVSFDTMSDLNSETCPSSDKQKILGNALVEEMKSMGITNVSIDENGYVYGDVPAKNAEASAPILAFIAHMDTSPDLSGKDVKPSIIKAYDGGDIILNKEKNIIMSPNDFEHMHRYIGQDLIVTDGTTLLGADNKAGIAEILTFVECLLKDETASHGPLRIVFTPDEEIGRGANLINLDRIGADFGYTVDGGELGEIEYENFNAASAEIVINGLSIHPGSAKGKMKNALLIGMAFQALLPEFDNPAYTEGYEGFNHLVLMSGSVERATLGYIIRDHDMSKFKEKKLIFEQAADFLNKKYGTNTVVLDIKDSYYNMKEKIEPHMHLIENAKAAMMAVDVLPIEVPIRGGTDGSRLSYMGLPCPNICTGGHNFHGKFEYIPVQSMEKTVKILLEIVKRYAK